MNISQALHLFWNYILELAWPLGLGFAISGLINEFTPGDLVGRYLGRKGIKPLLAASFFGALLPVCCFGSLPVAVTLRKKGAHLGPVLAFLVATPATSASALLVSFKLMGTAFTAALFITVVVLGLVIGMLANVLNLSAPAAEHAEEDPDCPHCRAGRETDAEQKSAWLRVRGALSYAFLRLPRTIGVHMLVGIALAALVESAPPVQAFIAAHLAGAAGYLASLALGLTTYVCSTASVPIANALRHSGMSAGAAFVYLLAGPITSYGTLLVVYKEFGRRTLALYLGVISAGALLAGLAFGHFFA